MIGMVLIYAAGHSCAPYALTLIKAAQSLRSWDWKGLILSLTSQGTFLQKGDCGSRWWRGLRSHMMTVSFYWHRYFSYSSAGHCQGRSQGRTLQPWEQWPLTVFFFSENLQPEGKNCLCSFPGERNFFETRLDLPDFPHCWHCCWRSWRQERWRW